MQPWQEQAEKLIVQPKKMEQVNQIHIFKYLMCSNESEVFLLK